MVPQKSLNFLFLREFGEVRFTSLVSFSDVIDVTFNITQHHGVKRCGKPPPFPGCQWQMKV